MKIYQLRYTSDGDVDAILHDNDGGADLIEEALTPSLLFTSLELAQAAAQELYEEEHRECLSQEEIDSEELSDNVPGNLEWEFHESHLRAYDESMGLYFRVIETDISDPTT